MLLLAWLAFGYAALVDRGHAPAGTLAANLSAESDLWRLPVGILLGAAAVFWLRRRGSLKTPAVGRGAGRLGGRRPAGGGVWLQPDVTAPHVYPVTPLIAFLQRHAGEGRVMPLNRRWSLSSRPPEPCCRPTRPPCMVWTTRRATTRC